MELMKESRPASAAFTAAVETRIVDDCGTMCAVFQAGETRFIPRVLFDAALTHGLMPVDPLELAPVAPVKPPPKEEIVATGLVGACKELIARGNPEDFTVVGQPRAASVKKLVDFNFTTKEVERAFSEAMHEVEQDGDDSTESAEPSSVTAE
jgi:hypothetical protein